MISSVYTGSDLKVLVNGTVLAECKDFRLEVQYAYRPINGVDSVNIFEYVPGILAVSGSVDFHRLRFVGGLEGRGALATFENFTQQKYNIIQVFDRLMAEEYLKIEQVVIERQSFSAQSKDLVSGSFSFSGCFFSTNFNPQD